MAAFTKEEVVHAIETLDEITTLVNNIRAGLMHGLEIIEDEEA